MICRTIAATTLVNRWLTRTIAIASLFAWTSASAQTPISNAAQVAGGTVLTCILTTDGGVKCWGSNVFASLGTGVDVDSAYAADVSGLTSGVTALAVGGYHGCAITGAGALKCWGANDNGELGIGDTSTHTSAVAVTGMSSGVVAVAAGGAHTCAVLAGGALKCWGYNGHGELGDGTTDDHSLPTDVSGLQSGVVAVATNEQHTCALLAGGAVRCWGANASGQLGDGTTTERHAPVPVSGLASGAAALAVGGDHSCALMQSGALKCWGRNGSGELGNGTTSGAPTPVDAVGIGGIVAGVAAGGAHTCVRLQGGAVKCWGSNSNGELGNGTTNQSSLPVAVSGIASGATSIGAGSGHSCAVVGGGVRCWGLNTDQQLGDGMTRPRLTAVNVSGLGSGMAAMSVGANHACGLTAGGGVRCWGGNFTGQLGDGTGISSSVPVAVSGLNSGVAAISAGYYFVCAVTTAGAAKCWGSDNTSQLGVGGIGAANSPVAVTGIASGATAIGAGDAHGCALVNGGVKCWGYNYAGALGDGTTTERPTAVDVTGLTSGVVAIAVGGYHSCAVTAAGAAKCWGSNSSGQLGDGTTTNRLTPVDVSGLGSGVVAMAAGYQHTCALLASGAVKCWGSNGAGQVGDGTASQHSTPQAVAGLASGVSALMSGRSHVCAIVSGAAKCWGNNREGELGDGTTVSQRKPVDVTGLGAGVTAIAGGAFSSCAVVFGAAKCWGGDGYGQDGDGAATSASLPVIAYLAYRRVVEFYNSILDNYFITADPAEQVAIDNGSAGPGWSRTGNEFFSAGPIAVCRFYGSLSPGPNSHFYTASAAECAGLIALQASTPASVPRWNFESNDFLTTAAVNGGCTGQTVPVYRAYNNGFNRHVDSNHRITNNSAAIADVVAKGWVSEGTVMCAPQ